MRKNPFALGLSLLGVAMAGIVVAGSAGMSAAASLGNALDGVGTGPRRHRGKGHNNRRGKGVVAKARKRSNMRTVSKRIRHKHRRAVRAR